MLVVGVVPPNSPTAVSLSKQGIWGSIGRTHADGAEYAWALARMHRAHPDFREGAKAFVKTASKAHWRGSFPRLVLWGFVAACVVVATFRIMLEG